MTVDQFDRIVAIDFSAASTATLGRDSLWVATTSLEGPIVTRNLSTRFELTSHLRRLSRRPGRTLLVIDVALGWPLGFARSLGIDHSPHVALNELLHELVVDEPSNRNNRFEVANELNRRAGAALFWGHPHRRRYPYLSPTTVVPPGLAPRPFDARRLLERSVGGSIKSPMQLSGVGAVGSQSMLAQVLIHRLRADGVDLTVWPFEAPTSAVVVGEYFFSLAPWRAERGECRDQRQVRAVARFLRSELLEGRSPVGDHLLHEQSAHDYDVVTREEGWLVSWPATRSNVRSLTGGRHGDVGTAG